MNDRQGDISVKLVEHVACLQIDRPPYNHVSVELMRDLADLLHAADAEKEVRAILLTSTGKSFCAGADLTPPSRVENPSMGIGPLYEEAVRLFAVKKPIVAAIQGAAVGAGLGLALIADFRVATPDARFSANFVKLGFHPGFGITHTLPRVVGRQRAELMCLTGRRIKADEALAWGLVDTLVPLDILHETALRLAHEIAQNAPLAVMSTRATFRSDLADAVRSQTGHELKEQNWLRQTDDFREGVHAVAGRRPGRFTAS